MVLFINTSDNMKTIVGLDDDFITKLTGFDKSQQVLNLINQILKKNKQSFSSNKKTLKDISKIKVETGPGSFTGLRVGLAVANTLGWALKIPVNGKKVGELVEPKYE